MANFGKLWDEHLEEHGEAIETAIADDVREWQELQLQVKCIDERICEKIGKILEVKE